MAGNRGWFMNINVMRERQGKTKLFTPGHHYNYMRMREIAGD
jgi:hypothetical protein